MEKYSVPLNNSEWGKHYNIKKLNNVLSMIENETVQPWAEELCNIIPEGSSCLEIGCGSGVSSLWLAKKGRKAVALDFSKESVELVRCAAKELGIEIDIYLCDATQNLPFKAGEFDYIFQSGLLEHFDTENQIKLLKNWGKFCKYMISMIPNASSIAYQVGKHLMEEEGTWKYGLEIPKTTLNGEFTAAGFCDIREYSIGTEWSTHFLPENHMLKKCILDLLENGYELDKYMQGYLLVTLGKVEQKIYV